MKTLTTEPGVSLNDAAIDALTGADLDAAIDEFIFGRKWYLSPYVYINDRRIDYPTWIPEGWTPEQVPAGWTAGACPPSYHDSLKRCAEAERKIAEMKLQREYAMEVLLQCPTQPHDAIQAAIIGLRAPADVRCRAMLKAMRGAILSKAVLKHIASESL